MRIIIAGSRDFTDYNLLERTMDNLTAKLDTVVILSGAAKGADELGEKWAFKNWFRVERFHADWHTHGKAAGHIRNSEMIAASPDCLVAFHKNNSPGTRDIIDKAKKAGLIVKIIVVEDE